MSAAQKPILVSFFSANTTLPKLVGKIKIKATQLNLGCVALGSILLWVIEVLDIFTK